MQRQGVVQKMKLLGTMERQFDFQEEIIVRCRTSSIELSPVPMLGVWKVSLSSLKDYGVAQGVMTKS